MRKRKKKKEEEKEEEEKEEETKGEDLRHYEQQVVWPTKDVGDISDMLQIKGKDDVHMVYGVQEGDWLKLTREKQKLMNKKRKMKKKRKRPWRKSYISPRCGSYHPLVSGCLSGKRSLKNLEQDKKFKERDIPGRLQQPDASFHSERNHQGNMMRQDKKRRRKRKRKTQQSRI